MADKRQVVTCRRCGMSFMVIPSDAAFLARYGVKVVSPVQCLKCYWKGGPVPKRSGQVKWFNARKRYGFLVDEDEHEVYFHQDQFFGENGAKPQEGQAVRFHVRQAAKGPQALNVELVGG